MICRLDNIEEYAQSYFSTGHIHASNDLRRIVEVIFPFHVKGANLENIRCFVTCPCPSITCMRPARMLQYIFFFTTLFYFGLQAQKEPEGA